MEETRAQRNTPRGVRISDSPLIPTETPNKLTRGWQYCKIKLTSSGKPGYTNCGVRFNYK